MTPDTSAKSRGIAAGAGVAADVLAERAGDGFDTASVNAPYTPPAPAPGIWQPTPPTFGPAVRAGLPRARPFLLACNNQFRPGPPPALDSRAYLRALAEVRAVGRSDSSVRTSQQSDTALFWEQSAIAAYTQVLRSVIAEGGKSLRWDARFVAAFHAVSLDAQIAIHEAKYHYVFWRPVTAIQTGSVDQDPTW